MSFKLDLTPLRKLLRKLFREPVPDEVRTQWSARYSAFARRRFTREGNNEWQKLAPSTLKRRRKSGEGAKVLRDTGTLLTALSVGASGNLTEPLKDGVRFGFSDTPHPDGSKTIRQIAIYHDTGAGSNPKRVILAEPDEKTVKAMGKDLARSIDKRGRRIGGRARGK